MSKLMPSVQMNDQQLIVNVFAMSLSLKFSLSFSWSCLLETDARRPDAEINALQPIAIVFAMSLSLHLSL